jgi:hypothetical protein
MSPAVQAIILLLSLASFATPVILIWGWIRWAKRKENGTASSILSLISLVLSTSSALLALSTSAFARSHPFGFYDPTLMRIMRWGFILSLAGCLFALVEFGGKTRCDGMLPFAGSERWLFGSLLRKANRHELFNRRSRNTVFR